MLLALTVGAGLVCPAPAAGQVAPSLQPVAQTATALAGRLDGLVTDHRGAPLPGAAITAQGGTLLFAVTDERGRFSFYGMKPGPYLVRAVMAGYLSSKRELVQVLPARAAWHAVRLTKGADEASGDPAVLGASLAGEAPDADAHDHGSIAWRLRHLKRGVLRDEGPSRAGDADSFDAWLAGRELERLTPSPAGASYAALQGGWLPGLPLSGQVQLLTSSNFDGPDDLFSASTIPAGIAYFAIGSPLGGSGHWTAQAAMAQGDLSSWTLVGTYATRITDAHDLDVSFAYGRQEYEGPDPVALAAVALGNRNAGAITVTDRWAFARSASLTVGTRHARYGYIEGPSMWSPSAGLRWSPADKLWLRASASQFMAAPGAEEFVPSPVGGLWLPSQRTFTALSGAAAFRPSRTRHVEVAIDRQVGSFVISARGFRQETVDQVVTMFGALIEDRPRTNLGHYAVANGGDVSAEGWGVALTRPVGSRVRGGIAYTMSNAEWTDVSPDAAAMARSAPSALRLASERVHDVTTTVETDISQTATRVFAVYRLSTGFAQSSLADRTPGFDARFDVQVNQRLPFLDFTSAEWEALVAVRNLFRETMDGMSIYDELLVVRPPKRIVGGLLVRF